MLALSASGAAAHSLAECDRVTHVSYGGVSEHRDLANGVVTWTEWWSQEGVYKTLWVADCDTGRALSIRTHEERISERYVHDRTAKAKDIIERQSNTGPFFTLERTAEALEKVGRDIEITVGAYEVCACHAAYPGLRGEKTEYGGHS